MYFSVYKILEEFEFVKDFMTIFLGGVLGICGVKDSDFNANSILREKNISEEQGFPLIKKFSKFFLWGLFFNFLLTFKTV